MAAISTGTHVPVTVIEGFQCVLLSGSPYLSYERLAAFPEGLQHSLFPSIQAVTECTA